MKVAVLMFHHDPAAAYVRLNRALNAKYCETFCLDFIFAHKRTYLERHPAWERLPLILHHLANYDYVVWIDSDAFFYHDRDVKEFIADNSEHDFIFSKDIRNRGLNTGVMVVKNTPYAVDFIKRWAYDEELYRNNPRPKFWDQGVLLGMYDKNLLDIRTNSLVVDYLVLQHFLSSELGSLTDDKKKPFIYHLAGKPPPIRVAESKKYFDNVFFEIRVSFSDE